jgi:hypothetical protein
MFRSNSVCDSLPGIVALAAYARILQVRAHDHIGIFVKVIMLQELGFARESKAFAAAAALNASCMPHEPVIHSPSRHSPFRVAAHFSRCVRQSLEAFP